MAGLIATIDRRPQTALAIFLALHVVVWTALPTLLYPNLPLDLIEALTYGREWQLGYDKLPPLPWWLIEIVYRLIGVDAAYYALAQIAVIGAFIAVWAMAVALVGPRGALVAILIIDGLHYFHYTAAKFNHDVIQLPLWALAGYAYWAALRGGRMLHWIAARARGRACAVGEVFRRHAGGSARFVPAARSRRAQGVGDAGPVDRAATRAAGDGAAPRLAGAQRFSAVRLCQRPRRAVARVFRSCLASAGVHARATAVPVAGAAHRRRAGLAAIQGAGRRPCRRLRPPHRRAAGVRPDGDHARAGGAQRARGDRDVGLSALAVPRPLDRAGGAQRHRRCAPAADRVAMGRRVRGVRAGLHRELHGAPAIRSPLPRGLLSRRAARRRNFAPAIARSPAGRSPM